MNGFSWQCVWLALLVAGLMAPAARGQRPSVGRPVAPPLWDDTSLGSHARMPLDRKSLELFQQQLQSVPEMRNLLKMLESQQQPNVRELRQELDKLFPRGSRANDELRKSIEAWSQRSGALAPLLRPNGTPRNTDQLLDLVKKFNPSVAEKLATVTKRLKQLKPPESPAPPTDSSSPTSDAGQPSQAADADEESLDQKFKEWVVRQAERLSDSDSPLAQSRAFQEALRSIRESMLARDSNPGALKESYLGRQLLRFGKQLHAERWLSDVDISDAARKITPSSFRRFRLRRLGLHWGGMPSVGVPNFGRPSATAAGSGTAVVVLLGLVAAAQIAWLIVLRYRKREQAAQASAWPTMPTVLGTRADVIRAFEVLSLRRLGAEARSWNHRAIAGELGRNNARHRQAADHLATLYEQARYAPEDEPLTADALAAARRELTFLAEAAAP